MDLLCSKSPAPAQCNKIYAPSYKGHRPTTAAGQIFHPIKRLDPREAKRNTHRRNYHHPPSFSFTPLSIVN